MFKKPIDFNGRKFAEKYNLSIFDFWDDGNGNIVCPSLPDITLDDVQDCLGDDDIN